MKRRARIYYTEADKALMWDRGQQGESLHAIARLFGRHHPSIRRILAASGGIRPPPRRRSPVALSLAEREEISRGVVAGHSICMGGCRNCPTPIMHGSGGSCAKPCCEP